MNNASTKPLHVLVLGQPDWGEDLPVWADTHTRIEHVDTVEAALEALRTE